MARWRPLARTLAPSGCVQGTARVNRAQHRDSSVGVVINSFGEAVLHRFSNPHHDWTLLKQSQYEEWVPSYTTSDISKDESPRKSLTKKTFIVRTTISFLPTKEENVFR
ncbi:hypothetical protein Trydic_g22578 [Trypoxylus dichotomus]